MILALDASITIARSHPDETTPEVLEVFQHVAKDGALAPPLWKIEVANVLQMQVRKGRYDAQERDRILADITTLNVEIDESAPNYTWSTVIELADRHTLTVYDAIYLDLALRRDLPLATLDKELRAAANSEGVQLLGL